ncbi:glycosyl hydrolase [Actinoplanes sp. SE50]|uniref:glycoside hydrolase family 18 protein n=1 Tax=unclassified Actinoplanes TaxID=2626549 RepID=UPI00023EC213|nr:MULTISPECIES: glycoside hydrolase family 18 protein [unclassified Actinoplanes]AEV82443.1 chitinase [Actinoplanes sp. SE50/110]ATO80840.1 glycosyl hydrolase [Actinoplanes sp. SE50]SLL98247.1 glycosyl hydrolase [Actinoplanes sp. SE50/110]
MNGFIRRFVAAAAAATVVLGAAQTPAEAQASKGFVKVGYFTQWGIYGRDFQLAKVQKSGAAARLTHLNYAFGPVTADGVCASADPWADWQTPFSDATSVDGVGDVAGQPIAGNLNQLAELKKANPRLRVLISLGGWSGSAYFSDAALTDASRRKLVSSCVDLWLKGNLPDHAAGAAAGIFDGVDLDWEWPGSDGNTGNVVRPEDKRNFTLLAAEFRAQLDRLGRTNHKHYDLTAFLPAAPAKIGAGFEADKIFRYLDFGTLQGYDFHGTWESRTNQQSALRVPAGAPDNPDFSVDNALHAWVAGGAPKNRIALGLPYYSQGWTGVTGGGTGRFQPATGPAAGTFGAGTEDYKVVKTLPAKGYTVHRDLRSGDAWLFDGTTYWTYDDPAVLLQKTLYIRSRGLAGAMMWSLDGDDDNATLTKTISLGLF